jgi:hypothetical protein
MDSRPETESALPAPETMWTVYRIALGYGIALSIVAPLLIIAIYAVATLAGGYVRISSDIVALSRPAFFSLAYTTPFFALLMPLVIAVIDQAFVSGDRLLRMIMPAMLAPCFVAVPMAVASWRSAHGLPISEWSRFLVQMDAGTILLVFACALKHAGLVQLQLSERSAALTGTVQPA